MELSNKLMAYFYNWSKDKVLKKDKCEQVPGHFCYPSINDRACRMCWEKEFNERNDTTRTSGSIL